MRRRPMRRPRRCSASLRLVAAKHCRCAITQRRGRLRPIAILGDLYWNFPLRVAAIHSRFTGSRTARLSAFTANGRHVRAIATDGDTALATRIPGFVGRPFVRRPLFVGYPPTFTGDLTLARRIHRREPASALPGHTPLGIQQFGIDASSRDETKSIRHRTSRPRRSMPSVANIRPLFAIGARLLMPRTHGAGLPGFGDRR